jgi:hypothetical protein
LRIDRDRVVRLADRPDQFVLARALQHIDLPGLGVGAAGRAAGHAQHVGQHLALDRARQEGARRKAALDGGVDAGRIG